MVSSWRRHVCRGTATAALAVLLAVPPAAQADDADRLIGFMAGGALGGAIGSLFGSGSGRDLAVGVGTALGAAYGYEAVRHAEAGDRRGGKRWRRAHQREYRHHAHLWVPPVVIERRRALSPVWRERVVVPPVVQPIVQPIVQPVVVAPHRARRPARANYAGRRPAAAARSAVDCRTLEGGPLPVYACTDGSGAWWLLD